MIFHLGGLETDKLAEGTKKGVPTELEDPREAPHEPLKPLVTKGRNFAKGATGQTGERK
jgi:hypothetical protein